MTNEKFGNGAGQLLAVKAENGVLSISIGVALMAWAVQNAPEWPQEFHITDLRDFSREMVRQLQRESEDGTTPVHRMLDHAANEVLEQGGDGVDEGDVETGLALAKPYLDAPAGDTDPAPAAAAEHSWFSKAALDVTAERRRQIEVEGWSPEHDDKEHSNGELAIAAACYAISGGTDDGNRHLLGFPSRWQFYGGNLIVGAVYVLWSLTIKWSSEWWKPTTRRRDLVKAGAFIIAEIERLDRAEGRP